MTHNYKITIVSFDTNDKISSLQSIAEKMKRHILAMTSIENSMDGEDAEETHRLLLAQEQESKSTQRFGNNILFAFHARQWGTCALISNAENLTYLLSWNNSNGFRWFHFGQCCKHRSYRDCIG